MKYRIEIVQTKKNCFIDKNIRDDRKAQLMRPSLLQAEIEVAASAIFPVFRF